MDAEANYVAKYDRMVKAMQMKVEIVTPDFARVSMPLLEAHKNGIGAAHGGAIFALADVAFGAAANANRKYGVVNTFSSIEFLEMGMVGPLKAEAQCVRMGGHLVNYDVHIFDGNDTLIAKAIISGYITRVPLPD